MLHACAFERLVVAMLPRLVGRSVVAWFPRSEAYASGFDFTSAALGVWRRWEYLQRSFISFSIRVARVSYIGVLAWSGGGVVGLCVCARRGGLGMRRTFLTHAYPTMLRACILRSTLIK